MGPNQPTNQPPELRIIKILTWTNVFRLVGFSFAYSALTGDLPESEVFGGIGDGIAGLAAIFVAMAISKRPSYATWLIAVMWNVYAMTDAFFANAISTFAPDAEPQAAVAYLIPLFFVIGHIISLRLLTKPYVRDYFLTAKSQ